MSGQTKMTVVSGTGGVQDADRVTLCGRAVEATVSVVTITSKSLQTVYVKPVSALRPLPVSLLQYMASSELRTNQRVESCRRVKDVLLIHRVQKK